MRKNEIEKLFLEEQFDNVLDILKEEKAISNNQYNYYMDLYYNEKEYKESFIKNILDKGRD